MERYEKAALNALSPPEARSEVSLASTLRTMLFFTALMIMLPIGLYFSTKVYIFEGTFGMSNRDSYFYAAIVAVVAVHVVLALFVNLSDVGSLPYRLAGLGVYYGMYPWYMLALNSNQGCGWASHVALSRWFLSQHVV